MECVSNGLDENSGVPSSRLRVVVIDNDPFVRRGAKSFFAKGARITVVGEAFDRESALDALAQQQPDIALMTVREPEESYLQLLKEIQGQGAPHKVIVTGMAVRPQVVLEALRLGASGFVSKESNLAKFSTALWQAMKGEIPIVPAIPLDLVFRSLRNKTPADHAGSLQILTPRETEVLECLVDGMSNKEIASALHISMRTVKAHVGHILEKLGATDRTQAVIKALRMGLFRQDELPGTLH